MRIAINGFGRIGRSVLRALLERGVFHHCDIESDIQLVAINDLADWASLLHLLKYDTTHGRLTDIGYTASIVNELDSESDNEPDNELGSGSDGAFDKSNNKIDNKTGNTIGNKTNDKTNKQYLLIEPFLSSSNSSSSQISNHLSSSQPLPSFLSEPSSLSKQAVQSACKPIKIQLLNESDPINLPWQDMEVDVVLECSGHFRSYAGANKHRQAGAKQVIIGAAPFDTVDECIVIGVNDHLLTRQLGIISSVSCTTQALVPLLATLDKAFSVKSVMMTEIHAVTADQNVLDQAHRDLCRARASGYNIIPTTSSSIAATERVLPTLKGKIGGYSIRVPTMDVAAIDVTFTFNKTVHIDEVKQLLRSAVSVALDNNLVSLASIMGYTDEPLVSSDFIHRSESLIVDEKQLMQVGEQIKVFAWYDNEWGYANRLVDMCLILQSR